MRGHVAMLVRGGSHTGPSAKIYVQMSFSTAVTTWAAPYSSAMRVANCSAVSRWSAFYFELHVQNSDWACAPRYYALGARSTARARGPLAILNSPQGTTRSVVAQFPRRVRTCLDQLDEGNRLPSSFRTNGGLICLFP